MNGRRVYIAGPMDSVGGNFNFPLFDYIADGLRERGFEVFSPADAARELIGPLEIIQKLSKQELQEWRCDLLAREAVWICKEAGRMVMLPNWEQSLGAKAEHAMALATRRVLISYLPDIVPLDVGSSHIFLELFKEE
jgi:hypothetical protein